MQAAASSGEQPDNAQPEVEMQMQAEAEENEGGAAAQDMHVPDVALLTFQKQRSTPKVILAEIMDDNEVVHAEVDDFGEIADAAPQMGMAPAGSEEQAIRILHKQGSLDARGIVDDLVEDPGQDPTAQPNI